MIAVAPRAGRRWLVLGLAILAYMLGLFHRVAPAALAQDLVQAFATSAVALGVLAATYFWVYTAMQMPCGVLADTLGPRRLLFGGGLIATAGAAMFGVAPEFGWAVCGRMLVGLGTAVAFLAALKLIATWFDERQFATLTGTVVLAGNLSSAAAGGPFAWVLQALPWRTVMLLLAGVSAVVSIGALLFVRDSPPGRPAVRLASGDWRAGLGAVLRNPASWPGFFANLGMGGAFLGFAGLWGVPYLVEVHGMTRVHAAHHASLMLASFACGGFLWGAISDRLRLRRPVFVLGAALLALCWTPFLAGIALPSVAGYLLCIAIGLGAAGLTMSWACAKEVNAPQYSGMATALVNTGCFLGPALMQPVFGWVLDWDRAGAPPGAHSAAEWQRGLWVILGFSLLGLAAALFVRETRARGIARAG
ncbi:MAG TPA: MFS transporter [Burkholderiales bacterium]|nr:MFS transporter [Burkholderiales bacterium]